MRRKIAWTLLLLIGASAMYSSFLWLKSYRSPQLLGKSICRVNTSKKALALTFDDGPSAYTKEILDILRSYQVPATFFLLGKHAERFPDLVSRIYSEGHEIGNHGYSHQPLIFKSLAFIREEIDRTDQIIRLSGYQGEIHFRAPYGRKLIGLPWVLYKKNRAHILFDVTPDDWANPGSPVIVERILAQSKPGSIILCHDGNGEENGQGRAQIVQALPLAIQKLKAAGYQFLTVSALIKLENF